jgi:hypothetical protein
MIIILDNGFSAGYGNTTSAVNAVQIPRCLVETLMMELYLMFGIK